MRDDVHAYVATWGAAPPRPVKPFRVVLRQKRGKATDTITSSLRYALERRDHLRRTQRPAYVEDVSGRRVEVGWT